MNTFHCKPKQKLALLLLDKHFFATWISTHSLQSLGEVYEVVVCVPEKPNFNVGTNISEVTFHEFARAPRSHTHKALSDLNWVGKRDKSPSFKFWLQRYIYGNEYWNFKNFPHLIKNLKHLISVILSNPILILAFMPPVRIILMNLFKSIEYFQNKTSGYIPDDVEIVIIPSQGGAEWEVPEIIRNCSRSGVLSVLSIDNWDNLTSKQVLRYRPDFLTVMGNTAVDQAVEIHGVRKESVLPIGLPRFDVYRAIETRRPDFVTQQNIFRINYLGFSIPYDEIQLLNRLVDDFKNQNGPSIELHYRPHPARRTRFIEALPDDRIIRPKFSDAGSRNQSLPDPSSYVQNLSIFDLIIATPTTMAIETMTLGIPCVIDATSDGIHRTSPGNAFDNYLHMQDLQALSNLSIARTYDQLLNHVLRIYQERPISIDYELSEVINLDKKTYIQQLIEHLPK